MAGRVGYHEGTSQSVRQGGREPASPNHDGREQPAPERESFQKGLGLWRPDDPSKPATELGWNLLREDLSLPVAVLSREQVMHNLRWMQHFAAAYNVKLAPHGKTSMAPSLFAMQLAHGAWGVTLATAHQTAVAYQHGVRRVLMANQLVGKANMAIISELLRDPTFEFLCLVDSPELIDQLGEFFRSRGQRLQVLLELGVEGGRTGARSAEEIDAVLHALTRWDDALQLRGVEVYEGVLKDESEVRAFLSHAVAVMRQVVAGQKRLETPMLLSGAGSAWYDVVAEIFAPVQKELPVEIVLRPGCYVTSDAGIYAAAQQRIKVNDAVASRMEGSLQPALQVWCYVQSRPERSRAILSMGKRDVAFDAGLPAPVLHYRPGWSTPKPISYGWEITKLMDQHAYLSLSAGDDLRVGDMIGCNISHPCLTFDKWRHIAMVDENYDLVDLVPTYF